MRLSSRGSRRASRRALSAVVLAAVVPVLATLLGPVAPASASSTYLCSEYAGCRDAGYSTAGYAGHNSTMYWGMYPGHNCTNYVAYRMVRAGMKNTRPWSGSGNATYWGQYLSKKVDHRPIVGSIAWWKGGDGVGSNGHVAYVERVPAKGVIVISEDSYSGTFHWRRIADDGSGWPTGFIHLRDRTLRATTAPTVSGRGADQLTEVGEQLTMATGAWTPAAGSKSVRWLLDGRRVRRGTTFTPGAAAVGHHLTAQVVARLRGYAPRTVTRDLGRVHRGTLAVTRTPAIHGRPRAGNELRLDLGAVSPRAQSTRIHWYADGEQLGVTGTTLHLRRSRVGQRISARVDQLVDGYRTARLRTGTTRPVAPPRISVDEPWSVRGRALFGRTLHARAGETTPRGAEASYRWLRDGEPLRHATGSSYAFRRGDVGHRVSLRVVLRRDGYQTRTTTVAGPGRTLTPSTLHLTTDGRPHRARVVVVVTAPGRDHPGGTVRVRIGRTSRTLTVEDGRAVTVLRGLDAGRRTVHASYAGDGTALPASASRGVRVRR